MEYTTIVKQRRVIEIYLETVVVSIYLTYFAIATITTAPLVIEGISRTFKVDVSVAFKWHVIIVIRIYPLRITVICALPLTTVVPNDFPDR